MNLIAISLSKILTKNFQKIVKNIGRSLMDLTQVYHLLGAYCILKDLKTVYIFIDLDYVSYQSVDAMS